MAYSRDPKKGVAHNSKTDDLRPLGPNCVPSNVDLVIILR